MTKRSTRVPVLVVIASMVGVTALVSMVVFGFLVIRSQNLRNLEVSERLFSGMAFSIAEGLDSRLSSLECYMSRESRKPRADNGVPPDEYTFLSSRLRNMRDIFPYIYDAQLVNPAGEIVLSVRNPGGLSPEPVDMAVPEFDAPVESFRFLEKMFLSPDGLPYVAAIAPARDASGNLIGTIVLQLNTHALIPDPDSGFSVALLDSRKRIAGYEGGLFGPVVPEIGSVLSEGMFDRSYTAPLATIPWSVSIFEDRQAAGMADLTVWPLPAILLVASAVVGFVTAGLGIVFVLRPIRNSGRFPMSGEASYTDLDGLLQAHTENREKMEQIRTRETDTNMILEGLLNGLPLGFLLLDFEGNVIRSETHQGRLKSLAELNLNQNPGADDSNHLFAELYREAREKSGKPVQSCVRLELSGRRKIEVLVSAMVVRYSEAAAVMMMIFDMEDLPNGRFSDLNMLDRTTHQLRNAFSTVYGLSQLMLEDLAAYTEFTGLQYLEQGFRSMEQILTGLQYYIVLNRGDVRLAAEPILLEELADELRQLSGSEARVRVEGNSEFSGDYDRLFRILENLVISLLGRDNTNPVQVLLRNHGDLIIIVSNTVSSRGEPVEFKESRRDEAYSNEMSNGSESRGDLNYAIARELVGLWEGQITGTLNQEGDASIVLCLPPLTGNNPGPESGS